MEDKMNKTKIEIDTTASALSDRELDDVDGGVTSIIKARNGQESEKPPNPTDEAKNGLVGIV